MASASSMPPTDQDLKLLLECSICLETFDDPRTLPCLHSFCKKCLENFVDEKRDDELNCPVCRGKFTLNEGVAGMTRNHFICNMVEVLSIQQNKCIPCSHCEQASVGRCVTCELFMCEKCFKPHNEYQGFQDHHVLTMEELSKPENQSKIKKISKCTQHPKKKVKYYCKTCDQLICRHCMDFDHDKQHEFSPLEQAAQSKRKDLKKNCEILEKAVANSDKETRVLKEDIQSLSNNFTMTQRLINERKQQLLTKIRNTVDTKTNTMIEDAREVFDGKKNMEEEIHENEAFFKRVKVSAEMARSLLENGDDEEIVRSYQSVQENVDNATKTECDRPSYHVGTALSLSSDEIDKMLLAEVKTIVEDKGDPQPKVRYETKPFKRIYARNATITHVYEDDYRQIQKLVQLFPNIETGGDLFGLWKDEKTVIIQQFIGPGINCRRTPTCFYQDIEYLHRVGSLLTTEEGLCNVGEWHSHHQMGKPEPSDGDQRTVFDNMPELGLERFVLFIASIEVDDQSSGKRPHDVQLDDIKLRPFLFLGSTQKVVEGKIEIIPGCNPHRPNSRAKNEIENGKEPLPKYIEGSGSRKPGKNKREAPVRTEKPKNVPTLKQQAKPRVETHGRHGESGADPPALSSSDDESVGGKPRDDQQRRRREQDQKTARNREEKGNQIQRRPNTSPAAPTDRGPQSLPTQSGTTPAWSPQTTSAPTSLRQVWDASSQFGTAQARGRAIQMNIPTQSGTTPAWSPQTTSAPTSLRQVWDASSQFGTAQARGRAIQMNIPTQSGTTPAWSPQTTSAPTSLRQVWDMDTTNKQKIIKGPRSRSTTPIKYKLFPDPQDG